MIEWIIARLPEGWRQLAELAAAPIAWIPRLQSMLIGFFMDHHTVWATSAKYVFLLFPVLLAVAAIWCTMLSVYTLIFRSGRIHVLSMLLLAWWDSARAVWMYWVGIVRLAGVVAGWLLSLGHLAVRMLVGVLRELVSAPFAIGSRATQNYFQPGVPWVAFVMLVFWCILEAAVFTYTLRPTITEVLADLVGGEEMGRYSTPILYTLLLMLILGSFACVQALTDAVKKREMKFLVQIVMVEIFVMMFEVMFLYRELVDAMTPWIAAQTGHQMGIWFTLSLATFGWVGIRGMTWFLFGRYGTPPLLAFIAREPIEEGNGKRVSEAATKMTAWWRPIMDDFKRDIEWLHERSDQILEFLALPVLHLMGAALNFAMILTASRPVFNLPFKSLKEVTEARDLLGAMHLQPRKQGNL